MPEGSKITAESSKASVKVTRGISPLDLGDKCFLCGHSIGEGVAPGFYQGKNATLIAHRGCIDKMDMAGGTPQDFHRVLESQKKPKPVSQHVTPVNPEPVEAPAGPPEYRGPRSIQFDTFEQLQNFIAARGILPSFVRVSLGSYVLQSGA